MKISLPGPWPDFGLLILRLGTGLTMVVHGWLKIAGGETLLTTVGTNWGGTIGIHFAPFLVGLFVALSQLLGGLLISLGFFARPAALLLAFVMAVGAVMVYNKTGTTFRDWSHPLEAAITCLAIAFIGTGRFTLGSRSNNS